MTQQQKFDKLSIFLPHGLKCQAQGEVIEGTEYDEYPVPIVFTITGSYTDGYGDRYVEIWNDNDMNECMITDMLPILRPLHDFTCEITYQGRTFIPSEEILVKGQFHGFSKKRIKKQIELITNTNSIELLDFWIVKLLAQWHFDLYGWINSYDAISIHDEQVIKRPSKYQEKLKIDSSFEDVIKMTVKKTKNKPNKK